MNLIEWLIHYPPFVAEVAAKVEVELKDNLISEGGLAGPIRDFKLTGPLKFEPEDCVGSTCSIPFTAGCKVSAEVKDAEGNSRQLVKEGTLFGYVDVAYPEGVGDAVPFETIYAQVERRVVIEESGLELD